METEVTINVSYKIYICQIHVHMELGEGKQINFEGKIQM